MADKPIDQMTNDEFREFVIDHMLRGWVPLKTYLSLFPSESRLAVETRVNRGFWKRGEHYNVPDGGSPWVNLAAIRRWASGSSEE